jgi:hypothetical protein
MTSDDSRLALRRLRATDSNSLLRLYDEVKRTLAGPCSRLERERADRAVRRVARELQSRDIRL